MLITTQPEFKMWRRRYIVGVVVASTIPFFLLTACAESHSTSVPKDHGIEEQFAIPESELAETKRQALQGDASAAERLFEYFSLYEQDHLKGLYWLQVEAENGDSNAALNLAVTLASRLPPRNQEQLQEDQTRACFWFRKATADPITRARAKTRHIAKECNRKVDD